MALTKATYSMIEGAPINVLDYGAVGDNSTNDAAAIQAAVDALPASGGALEFPSGKTFVIGTPINFTGKSDFSVTGFGATIRCGATRITSYLNLDGATNATIIGLTFDGRGAEMPLYTSGDFPTPYNVGVYSQIAALQA
jgi:polygalacturonase